MSERWVEVRFADARTARAAVTWAQRTMWVAHHRLAPHDCALLNVAFTATSPGRSLDDVLADLRRLVIRHDVLRTTFKVDEHGAVWQVAAAAGVLRVRVVEVAGRTPDDVAEQVRADLAGAPFDLVTALPVRVGLVVDGDAVSHVVLVGHHIALDGWSVVRLGHRLAEGADDEPDDPDAAPVLQPADQAEAEAGPDGQRVLADALDYWAAQLRAMPPALFTGPPRPAETPRFKVARLESDALAAVLPALCRRYRTTSSTVLLSGVLALLAVKTRHRRCGVQVAAANRDTPDTFDAVGCLYQEVMLSVDLAGARSFSDVVRRTWAASQAAYAHSRYDPLALYALVERVNAERGTVLDRTSVFNDERISPTSRRGAEPTAAPAPTSLDWLPEQYRHRGGQFHLWIDSSPRDSVVVRLMGDTTVLSSGEIREFLLGLEAVLLRAATEDVDLAAAATLTAVAATAAVDPASVP